MIYTPNTRTLTKEGWVPFKDLVDGCQIYTDNGWKTSKIERRKMDGDCFILERRVVDLELPEQTSLRAYDKKTDAWLPVPIAGLMGKDRELRRVAVKVGRFIYKEPLHYLPNDKEWCTGYTAFMIFIRGSAPGGNERKALVSLYENPEKIKEMIEIVKNSNIGVRVREYNISKTKRKGTFFRLFFEQIDFYGEVQVSQRCRDNILRRGLENMTDEYLQGFAFACLERYGLLDSTFESSGRYTFDSEHKAKTVEYIVSRFTSFPTRLSHTQGKTTMFLRHAMVGTTFFTNTLEPLRYQGYVYSLKIDGNILVRGSYGSFPITSGSL